MHNPGRTSWLLAALLFTGCVTKEAIFVDGPPPVAPDAAVADAQAWGDLPSGPAPERSVCTETIDVVFVLDVSSSMDFVLDKLEREIDAVVTASNALAKDSHFGLIAFVDNHHLDVSGPLDGGKVHQAADTLRAAFRHYKQTYTMPNRNPGDGPSGPTTQNPVCEENAPDALVAAAKDFPWRAKSTRVVILATDDTFLERPDNYGDRDGDGKMDKTDWPKEGDYPAGQTLADAVTALKGAKARVFSFSRLRPPDPLDFQAYLSKCGTPRRHPWEAVSWGWSATYKGQAPIPDQTDGKNFDLDEVRRGKLSLSETINHVVVQSRCNPIDK
ncbi:MAG: VWA domain-containing protein [Deltaproteobacteria bacterium]|nr:VWA domain-containing protein [Deltaproteobacteria bacterium]